MNKFCKYLGISCALAILCSSLNVFANYIVATPDQIMVTSEGLYVNVDGISLPVESLSMANDGYVVAIPSPQAAICPICGSDRYVRGRFCPICGFPDDAMVRQYFDEVY